MEENHLFIVSTFWEKVQAPGGVCPDLPLTVSTSRRVVARWTPNTPVFLTQGEIFPVIPTQLRDQLHSSS
jgi:hypothetical protein